MEYTKILILGGVAIPALICVITLFRWIRSPNPVEKIDSKYFYSLCIGTFFTFSVIFYFGFERTLSFLPEEWGGADKDGDWQSTQSYIGGLLAGFSGLALTAFFEGYMKLKSRCKRLSDQNDILRNELKDVEKELRAKR